jgi:23S rRNA-/tRNA-specific pseudouridylate synthase
MILTADRDGERLDAAVARLAPGLSRSAAQKLIEEGAVTRNGRPARKNDRLAAGDTLAVELPEARPVEIAEQDIPLDVVYEDGDVIVVNKPKGLVVHPAAGHPDGTLVNALLHHCGGSLSGINGEIRPGIVHRIDKDTSGLIIAAKNDAAHRALAAQLKDHSLARTYECIVCGSVREDSGTIDAPIGRSPADRKKMAVTEKEQPSRRDPLGGRGPLPRLHAPALPPRDGADAPDPRASGLAEPSDPGRRGLRPQKAGAGPDEPVPARAGADVRPPAHRRAHDRLVRAARVFPGGPGEARGADAGGVFSVGSGPRQALRGSPAKRADSPKSYPCGRTPFARFSFPRNRHTVQNIPHFFLRFRRENKARPVEFPKDLLYNGANRPPGEGRMKE